MTKIIEANKITKLYTRGSEKIYAVKDVTFSINKGEIVSVVGPSGSGKTTLVNILGCLDNLTSGNLKINNEDVFKENLFLSETELTKIRWKNFGYVFQKFFLIPTLTVYENIILPFTFYKNETSTNDVEETMRLLGIKKRRNHFPSQLSGGEMQRVAIARALVNNPPVLIADEPTGNLDSKKTDEIKQLFLELNKEKGVTIILVTHNQEFAKIGHRIINIKDGEVF